MEKSFSQWKKQCLNKLDLSKKGSVDEDIVHVVSLLNSCEEYFTTSSCSGRVILTDGVRKTLDSLQSTPKRLFTMTDRHIEYCSILSNSSLCILLLDLLFMLCLPGSREQCCPETELCVAVCLTPQMQM